VTDDRATRQFLDDFFSESGSGGGVQGLPGNTDSPGEGSSKPPRTRQLRATFREPTTGFPGANTFSARSSHAGAPGATLQPAAERSVDSSTNSKRSDDSQGRGAAVLAAGGDSGAVGAAEPEAEGTGGGGLRGWSGAAARTAAAKSGRSPGRPSKNPIETKPVLPAAIQKLVPKSDTPSPSKLIPTESERATASRLFREIGQRFNENRKKSKTAAYAGFRHDLMDNLDTLVMGGAIDLKEATSIITNLEQYTKETEAESTETPATILGRWLRMDAAEVAGLEVVAVEEVVDDEENLGEEIDELDAAADPMNDGDSEAVT